MKEKSVIKKITGSREVLLAVIVVILCIIIQAKSSSFLTPTSISDLLKNNAVIMILALGMLNVLLIGGIDISIASTCGLTGMSIGMLAKYGIVTNVLLLFIIGLVIGIVCGFLVGIIIAKGNEIGRAHV